MAWHRRSPRVRRHLCAWCWLFALTAGCLSAQETLIQIRAFLVRPAAEKSDASTRVFYRSSSEPRLAPLQAMAAGTESDLRAAVLRAIPALEDIETAQYLFSVILFWDGRREAVGDFVVQPPDAFRFEIIPAQGFGGDFDLQCGVYAKEISPWPPAESKAEDKAVISLRAAVHPDYFRERMDKILSTSVSLALEEPGLLFLPFYGQELVIFLMPAARPQPITQVLPIYPRDLLAKGVTGQGSYRISIDEKGAVRRAAVITPLNPFLDDAAVKAIQRWTFEPVVRDLKAVPVSFDWKIDFNPAHWPGAVETAAPRNSEPYSPELKTLLALGAAYCDRLSRAALDFVCVESIHSLDCALDVPESPASTGVRITTKRADKPGETFMIASPRRAPLSRDPFSTKTYRLRCDYQMVRKQGRVEERRVLLASNDKSAPKGGPPPFEKRYSSLKPLFAPTDILAADRQASYDFRVRGKDTIKGRAVVVIEALARPGSSARIPAAKIWVDPRSSQVLRCETEGLPIEGYEFVFDEASRIGLSPIGRMTVTYEEEKNGILFPSRSNFLIEYSVNVWGVGRRTRVDTDIRYDKYRFFVVETEKPVIRAPSASSF